MDCVINPITGRAVKINSPAGRRALKYIKKNNLESSYECVMNPRTGRAVKKDSAIGRKILKGLITAPAPKPAKAYTMYKKPIDPIKPAPKPAPKPKPAPITIPKKKYDFGNFKTPPREPDSPPMTRTRSIPKDMGESEKIKSKKKGIIKSPVAKKETNNKLAKLEEFINDTENYLNKKSTRGYNTLMKKYDDKEYIASIIGAQMFGDFYPTSQKCLDHYSNYIENFDENDIILEPTAGLGSIVLWLLKNNVKSKIITTDFDGNLNELLKKSFESINQVSVLNHIKSNYLKIENDFHRYNPTIIFLNPPFSNGNDKKYYINFLFKAIYDLKMSEHAHMERQLFFISPKLTKGNEKDGRTISFDDIVISKNKKQEIKEMLNINEEEFIELMPEQTNRIKACKDFGGTSAEAVLYQMFLFY